MIFRRPGEPSPDLDPEGGDTLTGGGNFLKPPFIFLATVVTFLSAPGTRPLAGACGPGRRPGRVRARSMPAEGAGSLSGGTLQNLAGPRPGPHGALSWPFPCKGGPYPGPPSNNPRALAGPQEALSSPLASDCLRFRIASASYASASYCLRLNSLLPAPRTGPGRRQGRPAPTLSGACAPPPAPFDFAELQLPASRLKLQAFRHSPKTSSHLPLAENFKPFASRLKLQASCLPLQASCLSPQASNLAHHASRARPAADACRTPTGNAAPAGV
jgi:hypothetical protein